MADDTRNGMTRRDVMRCGVYGAAGLLLSGGLSLPVAADTWVPKTDPKAKAKAVIQVWLWGGPSQLDTFDPKPEAGPDYTGPLNSPIATNVDGLRICQLLPELAKIADKYSIIRSATHGSNGHETAAYITQTGRFPGGSLVYPGAGAVVSLFKGYEAGYKGLIPPYIVLTTLQGRFAEAGFLGSRAKPFATGGNPAAPVFAVEGVVAEGITEEHQKARRDLMHALDTLGHAMPGDSRLAALSATEKEAYDLILGDAGKVFDLSQEKDDLRTRYGKNTFGQSCLAARRLVEKGVPWVTINYPGWDMHKAIFPSLNSKLPQFDKGLSTLLVDLSERGLLDSTIVWCCGEFGRTPRVMWEPPWNGGRGHWGPCFSVLLAGGGFKGGHVVGSSDEKGEYVKDRPVYPCDILRSMYIQLGIDPDGTLPHPQGLKVTVSPTAAEGVKTTGPLTEIM